MELYAWVHAINRFAHNAREILPSFLVILDAAEMLLVRLIIFGGFLYGVYAYAHGH
jgi:hypothetical protein